MKTSKKAKSIFLVIDFGFSGAKKKKRGLTS